MRAPTYDETTIWLIEGLADYVRDELGHDAPWTQAHFERDKATAGYQTTAHFLQHVERQHPGTVRRLAQALMDDTYAPDLFRQFTGMPLEVYVSDYEAAQRVLAHPGRWDLLNINSPFVRALSSTWQ